MKINVLATCALLLAASNTHAACDAEEHRQFDFWLGKWRVVNAGNDKLAGENDIRKHLGDCAIYEHYKSHTSDYEGTSYNIYERHSGRWHQTWVDNSGLLLQLDGGLVGNEMVLSGERTNEAGDTVTDRITWTPEPNGAVRQHWQFSTDGGQTWQTLFDGRYEKAE